MCCECYGEMRKILFKGKRIDNGEWIEGNLFISDADGSCYILIGSRRVTIEYQVYPETVCQYTGKKDKNGKRIFEGDVVVGENYKYKEQGIKKLKICFDERDCGFHMDEFNLGDIEVICNVHDL